MTRRPLSTEPIPAWTYTIARGRNPRGRTNARLLWLFVIISPWNVMMPPTFFTCGRAAGEPNHFQPLRSFSLVNPVLESANEAPSSEVKHTASADACASNNSAVPFAAISRRPGRMWQTSTETMTLARGRKRRGRTKTGLPAPPESDPIRCTIPEMARARGLRVPNSCEFSQPFSSVSRVKPIADGENDAPSSDVKHWYGATPLSCACTYTEPL